MSRKQNLFTQVPVKRVPRNLFDLGHEVKMSGKFGYLYPVLLVECMPGDTVRDTMVAQVRMAPMLAPIMHRVDVKTDFFFVPMRLVAGQETWEEFITGGQDGLSEVVLPFVRPDDMPLAASVTSKGTLWDYLGLPVFEAGPQTSNEEISILPFRAYAKIWNDYFRDPNLDDEIDLQLDTEGNVSNTFTNAFDSVGSLKQRGWERDYFTAALPFAQRGATVLMPLAGTGSINWSDDVADATWQTFAGGGPNTGDTAINLLANLTDSSGQGIRPSDTAASIAIDGASTTINDFRRALAIQAWMENNARGGGRYIEQIQAHYNVRVPDYRLQRAEYCGGGRQPMQISEVLSTADTENVPVGDMAGHGYSAGKSNRFTYRAQEHGYLMGIMSIVPRTAYDQGIPKLFSRTSRFDFAFPEFANLGEQQILSKEVFYSFDAAQDANNNTVFGYIPRYAEYKFMLDRVAGDFRDTLNFWHLGRIFNARPVLDSDFVTMKENNTADEETSRRIFAVQDGTDYLWIQLFHRLTAKRPLPYFGVPQLNG